MPFSRVEPGLDNQFMPIEAQLILDSYEHFLGKSCIELTSSTNAAQVLYEAPFAVVAHDTQADPIFGYANRIAQNVFEMAWAEITSIPSRQSAEPVLQEERQSLLQRVQQFGFIDDYSGIRISKTGKRFWIRNATVWNLIDTNGVQVGQAARFDHWDYLSA
ncbi:MEKHLA domain-containing protein [Polynucleobacter acidiphobus]|uniref:MEKHLA domain-containing protein n=1 Tax=Polynucleobacter acidiphobus TaxID=556053 RepID=UPI000D39231F|nr:MEKHLA domain-containing protein [Polynucleobacter acidiphobus]